MTGDLFINEIDAWDEWGVFLEDGSEDKLLMAAPMKDYISNKSRLEHGKQVLATSAMIDEREVTLVFCFANDGTEFLTRYNSFVTELYKGAVTLSVTSLGKTFNLLYQNTASLSSMAYAGKCAVNFNEPNPNNRTTNEVIPTEQGPQLVSAIIENNTPNLINLLFDSTIISPSTLDVNAFVILLLPGTWSVPVTAILQNDGVTITIGLNGDANAGNDYVVQYFKPELDPITGENGLEVASFEKDVVNNLLA